MKERKARQQQACSTADAAQNFVHEISSTFGQTLNLKESSDKVVALELSVGSRKDTPVSFEHHDSLNQKSGSLSRSPGVEEGDKVVASVTDEVKHESIDKEEPV